MAKLNHAPIIRSRKPRARVLFWTATLVILLLALSTVVALAFTQSQFVSFTLEGCRFFAGLTLPDSLGRYVCPDSAYTTGNLAKGWNELDLVPHRLHTTLGNQGNATTDYNVYVAADHQTSGKTGYDVISVPVVNTALSDASCTVTAGPQSTMGSAGSPFGGGTDVVIYRELTIHQNKGTTCVFDYYQRLALGASLYSGSSLQSYMFEQAGLSGGKKTISIPVNEILPQSINKDMTASQAAAYTWSVTKSPSPANLSFSDTCDTGQPKSQGVQITVSWEKLTATPGKITVITHIYATNPSARVVTVNVTDKIYAGTTPSGPVLHEASSGPVNVSANTTNFLLLSHTAELDPGPTSLNDVAIATYTDLATGLPIPGNTTATASAPVQVTYTNASAVINDLESITGTGLSYSADSFSGASGTFDGGYIAGSPTIGNVSWTSVSQSGNNSVTFSKTVYVAGPSQVSGNLHDIATLNGSDGFQATNTADVAISTDAKVSLKIIKNIDRVLASNQTFTFKVKDPGSNTIATPSLTILAGQMSGEITVPNLLPGIAYTVSEDPLIGWVAGPPQTKTITLPTCSDTVTFSNASAQDLTVSLTADPTFHRTYKWLIDKSVDDTRIEIAEGGTAKFNYAVKVTPDGYTDSAWTGLGKITVTNPNAFDFAGVNVTDVVDVGGGASCTVTGGANATIPAGKSVEFPYTCSFSSQPAYSGTNTATATWDAVTYNTPDGSASATVPFNFVLKGETNKTITVVDDKTDPLNPITLGTWNWADGEHTFTYTLDKTGEAGKCKDYTNKAAISETGQYDTQKVTVCVGKDLTVSKTAAGTFGRTYLWLIDKSVDDTRIEIAQGGKATFNYSVKVTPNGYTDGGWSLGGKVTVTNPNDWEDILADVTDSVDIGGGASCTVTGGSQVKVPKSGNVVLNYSCTFSSQPAYTGKNTATATWDKAKYFTPNGTATGQANISLGSPAETNKIITVIDDKTDPQNPVTLGTWNWADGVHTFTYSLEKPGKDGECVDYTNTAVIKETKQSDSQVVTVCVGLNLTVTKTVDPQFTREYFWQITKGVDKTKVTLPGGGTATFNYTVGVTETGFVDSAWVLKGKITITNPNKWEAIQLTSIEDSVIPGWNCSVPITVQQLYYLSRDKVMLPMLMNRRLGAVAPQVMAAVPQAVETPAVDLGVVVPANGSVQQDYTCTWVGSGTPPDGTNTATVKWDKDQYFTPAGSASGTAGFTFVTPATTVNKTITVIDFFGGLQTTLGTVTATDTKPYASKIFTYPRNISAGYGCKDYPNTARIVETGQTADQQVTVCGPTQTGARTMGFWQNKNGQGIIKSYCAPAGKTSLYNFLTTYKPFQDLTSPNCLNIATYVYNIIKATNAGGTAMNPMLKAQMLATALDVYFSDPTLGGNKLGSPAPIGTFVVDLTKVCASVGSGCATEDASSAFGGATSMTVSELLVYAASKSNVGGSLWYGNVKSTQELAKDTFDAINNQVAVSP